MSRLKNRAQAAGKADGEPVHRRRAREAMSVPRLPPGTPASGFRTEHGQPAILLVDDRPAHLLALEAMLRPLGQPILRARSMEEALRALEKHDPAVILLDVHLPGVAECKAAGLLAARHPPSRLPLLLTGPWREANAVLRECEWDAIDYLPTPLVPAVLRWKVSLFLDLYVKNAALREEVRKRQSAEAQLRALAARLISTREEERASVAREIHDELGQVLTGLKMDVTWLAGQLAPAAKPVARKVQDMLSLMDSAMQLIRRISAGLRPDILAQMGLVAALDWQARDFEKRMGMRCRIRLPPAGAVVDKDVSTAIFRIFQEALTNVARHARASCVEADLRISRNLLTLKIRDDGIGIPEARVRDRDSLGLLGMRERARIVGGKFRIRGSPGRWTSIFVSVPRPSERPDFQLRPEPPRPLRPRAKPKQRAER